MSALENRIPIFVLLSLALCAGVWADAPVSWFKDVNPIFKRSCNGCHNPNKLKGEVDTSTYTGLLKPGKHGPNFVAGQSDKSLLCLQVAGKEPEMPKEGDALSADEVALIARWIQQGAIDDTPTNAYSTRITESPVYSTPPVISAMSFSPDGHYLAISGYHETFLFDATNLTLVSRLLGEAPRIEGLAFSPDSKVLAVAAGAPARFGEVQLWDVASASEVHAWKLGSDSLFGISWSPDGTRLAFGGVDKSVRVIAAADGHEVLKFDNHSDWVFRTAWMADGKRLLSGSRDRAMKLIDAGSGQFIDDINKLLEPILSMARHPREEWAVYGGTEGGLRIYKAKENQERTDANNDVNQVRSFERQPGAVHAVAFSPDGTLLVAGGAGPEVRIYRTADGARTATLTGHTGAVFAVAFSPNGDRVFTGGFDGLVRMYDPATGHMDGIFTPIRLIPPPEVVGN